jgi:hypothetical protein
LRVAALPGSDNPGGVPAPPGILPKPPADAAPDPSLVDVGSVESNTANSWDGPTLVSHAETRLTNVTILGGLMTIDSIVSTAESRFTSGQDPVGGSSTTVQGVKVNGQGVSLGSDGVSSGSNNEGDPSALNQALQALQSSGLTVRLLDATQGVDANGFMAASAPGVAIEYSHPIDNPVSPPCLNSTLCVGNGSGNYFVITNLASVSAKSLAHDITHNASTSVSHSSSALGSLPSVAPTSGTKPSGFTGGAVSAPAPPPPSALAAPSDDSASQNAGFLGIDPGKVRFLYLAFTLGALGACLGPGLLTPARLGKG